MVEVAGEFESLLPYVTAAIIASIVVILLLDARDRRASARRAEWWQRAQDQIDRLLSADRIVSASARAALEQMRSEPDVRASDVAIIDGVLRAVMQERTSAQASAHRRG